MQEIGSVESEFYKKTVVSRELKVVKGENFGTHNTFLENSQVDRRSQFFYQ